MSTRPDRTAARDYSRGRPGDPDGLDGRSASPWRPPAWATPAAAATVAVGAVAVLLATVLPVLELRAPDRAAGVDTTISGWTRTKALLPLAGASALGLLGPAVRGRVAAAAGVAMAGVATVAGLLAFVAPRVGDVILVGAAYDEATIGSGPGWYVASGGAVALIVGGGTLAAAIRWSPPVRPGAGERPRRAR